jgi:hypothetical protein
MPARPLEAELVRHASCFVQSMLHLAGIKPHMAVISSEGTHVAFVDHLAADNRTIKLARDANGVHHYIPVSWVTRVDQAIFLDRPTSQVMREWTSEAA